MTPHHPTQDPPTRPGEAVTFALERFTWAAPDRLELAGTFDGLGTAPTGAPVLVLAGAGGTYRLTAVPGDVSGPPANGEPWTAAFVWHEAPAAFDAAMLELGDDLAVDLPAPSVDASPVALEARSAADASSRPVAPAASDGLGAHAELLTLREDVHVAQEHARRLGEELARARADLDAEREGRAEDAARYRAGLAEIRDAADAALREQAEGVASATAEVEQLREQLATARAEAADARNRLATVREALQLSEPGPAEG